MNAGFFIAEDGAKLYSGDASLATFTETVNANDGVARPLDSDCPVVLLHSLFFNGTMFDPVRALLPADMRVLTPDHRNQGRSDAGTNRPSIAQLANDTIRLIEDVVKGPVHIVGSSMGGYVAMHIAERRPDLLKTCVLSCCTAYAEREPDRFAALEARIREEGTSRMGATLVKTMFGERFSAENNALCQAWQQHFEHLSVARPAAEVADAVHGVFAREGFESRLSCLTMPVLLFSGEMDRAKRPADMAFIAERVPGSQHVVVADAGHTPPVERPDLFALALLRFWRESASNAAQHVLPTSTYQELS